MPSMRPASRAAFCLVLLAAMPGSTLAAEGRPGHAPSSPPLRIVESRGGDPYVTQGGALLVLQVEETATIEVALPHSMTVVTAARHGDAVWIAGQGIVVAEVTRDGTLHPLPEPMGREDTRTFPTLLADRERIAGIVWQEGDRQETNSIRAAAWLGEDWGPVEMVSPARGREQTGLTATVLADGSWLAVWAAVDDADDLWWARRDGVDWSAPRRVHPANGVPDVLPRLTPTRDGALLAWTAYDGNDYRLRLAALEGETWVERPVAGGRGAEPARWLALAGARGLLYSSVEPDVWSVVRLDGSGRELGRLEAAQVRAEVPMVVERGSDLFLRWPQTSHAEAAVEIRLAPAQEPRE